MCMRVPSSFQEHFASLSDPRSFHAPNQRHELIDLLVIAVCAVICGAEGWEDIEEYGQAQADWFAEVLDLPNGIPGHDTFRRVLSRLDPDELTQCFVSWTTALSDLSGGDIVAIDGKTLRHSFDRAASTKAIHMVSAWADRHRLVLGQVKVDDKSNEITAIPKLLKMLDLSGATVTIDAMGCQKEIAKAITEQGADYVLALKKNHSTLYENVTLFLDDARATDFAEIAHDYHETVDGDHGRIETRRYWITDDIDWLGAKASWANLQSLGLVSRVVKSGTRWRSKGGITWSHCPLMECDSATLCGSTGALRMGCIGSWMSPLMRMRAGFAKTKGRRHSVCCAISR